MAFRSRASAAVSAFCFSHGESQMRRSSFGILSCRSFQKFGSRSASLRVTREKCARCRSRRWCGIEDVRTGICPGPALRWFRDQSAIDFDVFASGFTRDCEIFLCPSTGSFVPLSAVERPGAMFSNRAPAKRKSFHRRRVQLAQGAPFADEWIDEYRELFQCGEIAFLIGKLSSCEHPKKLAQRAHCSFESRDQAMTEKKLALEFCGARVAGTHPKFFTNRTIHRHDSFSVRKTF